MKELKTEKEWAEFGKHIYDTALNHFRDKPIKEVIIPFRSDIYGEHLKVSVTDFRQIIEPTGPSHDRYRSHRKGWVLSNGSIEWEKSH